MNCSGVMGVENLWDFVSQTAGRFFKKKGGKGFVSTQLHVGVSTVGCTWECVLVCVNYIVSNLQTKLCVFTGTSFFSLDIMWSKGPQRKSHFGSQQDYI